MGVDGQTRSALDLRTGRGVAAHVEGTGRGKSEQVGGAWGCCSQVEGD
jgi:hypothetical protein